MDSEAGFSFTINHAPDKGLARVGTISTPHGDVQTPAFIPVGTKANVKTVIADGFQSRADVCKIATEAVCKANGI